MDKIDIINSTIKVFFISIYLYVVYIKLIDLKEKKQFRLIIIFMSFVNTVLYAVLNTYTEEIISIIITFLIYGIIISRILNNKIYYSIILTLISFAITYATYIIAIIISGLILKVLIPNISYKNPISLITIPLIEGILLFMLSKVKRFKRGINFLKNVNILEDIGGIVLLFGGISILLFGLLQNSESTVLNGYVFTGAILTIISIIVWTYIKMTKYYKENMKNRTIDIQKNELESQNRVIEELKENNIKLSSVIHRYNNRFSALENAIINALSKNSSVEFSSELSIMLEDLKKMSENFSDEVFEITQNNVELPTTNILSIDNIIKYMSECARKDKIIFDLKINNEIDFLINNIITREELETLLGDHIKDAIIAINTSDNGNRSIMVIIGIIDNAYEICIYDTGIEFEIKTLKNLGLKRITTHKNEGGTGIGYMTTFELLRRINGSIIIQEYNKDNYYTKSVNIRFDGKNEYKICSYRASKLRDAIGDKRIIIEEN